MKKQKAKNAVHLFQLFIIAILIGMILYLGYQLVHKPITAKIVPFDRLHAKTRIAQYTTTENVERLKCEGAGIFFVNRQFNEILFQLKLSKSGTPEADYFGGNTEEFHESIVDIALTELHEETGLDIENKDEVFSNNYLKTTGGNKGDSFQYVIELKSRDILTFQHWFKPEPNKKVVGLISSKIYIVGPKTYIVRDSVTGNYYPLKRYLEFVLHQHAKNPLLEPFVTTKLLKR